jgi:hypothetical protein
MHSSYPLTRTHARKSEERGRGMCSVPNAEEAETNKGACTHPIELSARELVELADGQAVKDGPRDGLDGALHHLCAVLQANADADADADQASTRAQAA